MARKALSEFQEFLTFVKIHFDTSRNQLANKCCEKVMRKFMAAATLARGFKLGGYQKPSYLQLKMVCLKWICKGNQLDQANLNQTNADCVLAQRLLKSSGMKLFSSVARAGERGGQNTGPGLRKGVRAGEREPLRRTTICKFFQKIKWKL